ncbi:Ger(x)C family spore germination protein [Paenibacillus eucommiae]|uniref:Spore germination protein KC n=1 Tax=Paenibacillus eucommiae TaxID=1355755 RepID=A0ABS4J276_9BACL|nr:Ger(x)C family spore germination protein [Paenibacillus eucommiae]MBP1993934.1 spore germination protein KC [Paenibacillus eucommiae]
MRILIVIWAVSLLLSGCSFSFKDIDKRFFVVAMGIDKSGNPKRPFKVSLKLGIPTSEVNVDEDKFIVIQEESETIAEAIRLLKTKVDKELDLGHTKIFILGKSLAETDVTETLDWLVRRRDVQLISFLAVGDPDAASLLNVSPKSERFPANTLFLTFSQDGVQSSYIFTELLFDFYRRTSEKGLDPYLPIITTKNNLFQIKEVALLDKQKIKLNLTPDETQLLDIFIKNGFHKFSLKLKTEENLLAIAVTKTKGHFSFTGDSANPTLQIHVTIKGVLEETKHPLWGEKLEPYQQAIDQEIEAQIERLFKKMISAGVDPVGIGLHYRASRYVSDKDWEGWLARYPELPIEAHVEVNISSTGVIK